jgi:hypothetical protein
MENKEIFSQILGLIWISIICLAVKFFLMLESLEFSCVHFQDDVACWHLLKARSKFILFNR